MAMEDGGDFGSNQRAKVAANRVVYQLQNGTPRLKSGKIVLSVSYSATEKRVNVWPFLLRMTSERSSPGSRNAPAHLSVGAPGIRVRF
jgi:hypothetical protein